MPKAPKSVNVISKNLTKEERQIREQIEAKLKSDDATVYKIPAELKTKAEKELYSFLVDNMRSSGILCNLDIQLLICCVRACIHMNEAEKLIKKNGLIDSNGKKNVAIDIFNNYQKTFAQCCSSLCLSPSARAKIGSLAVAKQEDDNDPFNDIFKDDDE